MKLTEETLNELRKHKRVQKLLRILGIAPEVASEPAPAPEVAPEVAAEPEPAPAPEVAPVPKKKRK